jgi:uncharacterized membrane protein YkoI
LSSPALSRLPPPGPSRARTSTGTAITSGITTRSISTVTINSESAVLKFWPHSTVVLGLLSLSVRAWADDPAPRPVLLTNTPAAVQAIVTRLIDGGKLSEILPGAENGENSFEVSFVASNGREHNFTIADDGTMLSTEVEPEELPPLAWHTIHAQAPGWKVEEIDKNLAEAVLTYDVLMTRDGRERNLHLDVAGELQSRQIFPEEAPPAVWQAITNEVPGGRIDAIDENFETEANTFDVEARSTNSEYLSFQVSERGTLLSRQITLDQILPVARRTIRLQLGPNGKVIRLDRWLNRNPEGVTPIQVTGRKDGLPYNFLVGTGGRFLGRLD